MTHKNRNGKRALSFEQCQAIRVMYSSTPITMNQISELFSVHVNTVKSIIHFKTYRVAEFKVGKRLYKVQPLKNQ